MEVIKSEIVDLVLQIVSDRRGDVAKYPYVLGMLTGIITQEQAEELLKVAQTINPSPYV